MRSFLLFFCCIEFKFDSILSIHFIFLFSRSIAEQERNSSRLSMAQCVSTLEASTIRNSKIERRTTTIGNGKHKNKYKYKHLVYPKCHIWCTRTSKNKIAEIMHVYRLVKSMRNNFLVLFFLLCSFEIHKMIS